MPMTVPAFVGGEGVAWSAQRIPTAINLGFLDRSSYLFFIQVAAQLFSLYGVDPVSLLRKCGRAGNQTRTI
jgi:hypothetical protein